MDFFKYPVFFVILLLFAFGLPARAEVYEPGRGILLPKRGSPTGEKDEKKTIKVIRDRNTSPAIVNKQGVILPNQGTQGVLTPQKQDNNAQKLTSAYAAHLYTSVCAQQYRDSLVSITEENINRQKMWTDIQASCKCLSNQILSVVPAADLADYVMYTYGAQQSSQSDPQATAFATQKGGRIDQMLLSGALQKKCGFLN